MTISTAGETMSVATKNEITTTTAAATATAAADTKTATETATETVIDTARREATTRTEARMTAATDPETAIATVTDRNAPRRGSHLKRNTRLSKVSPSPSPSLGANEPRPPRTLMMRMMLLFRTLRLSQHARSRSMLWL